jgi:Stress responsive A/B Barrel Domain
MKKGIMRKRGRKAAGIFAAILCGAALFGSGYVAGQNRFGQPKTIIHLVELKWNPGVTDAQKQGVINGLKEIAAKVPGIRNVWLKADRLEPRDFSWAYAIEFRDRDAADAYAESAAHEAWEKRYVPLRYTSISVQVTNP